MFLYGTEISFGVFFDCLFSAMQIILYDLINLLVFFFDAADLSGRPVGELDNSKQVFEVPYEELKARADAADIVIYFYINVYKPNFSELHHLDAYVQETLQRDPDHVFYLTGSADKGTGTFERNTFLCRQRAYEIRDIRIRDYGVKENNIVIKSTIISDKHIDGALDRCVIIESE